MENTARRGGGHRFQDQISFLADGFNFKNDQLSSCHECLLVFRVAK